MENGWAEIWDVAAGWGGKPKLVHAIQFSASNQAVFAARFHPGGNQILLSGGGGRAALWSVANGQYMRDLDAHRQGNNDGWRVSCARFTPDRQWVLTGGFDTLVRVHSLATGQTVGVFKPVRRQYDAYVHALAVDDPTGRVLFGTNEGIRCVRLRDQPLPLVLSQGIHVEACVSEDGRTAFTSATFPNGIDQLQKWDLRTGAALLRAPLPLFMRVRSLDLHGDRLAVVGERGPGLLLDAKTGARIAELESPVQVPTDPPPGKICVRFSPDGKTLAVAVGTWQLHKNNWMEQPMPILLFDGETGEYLDQESGHFASVFGLAFSPDGSRMASTGHEQAMVLWKRTADGGIKELRRIPNASRRAITFDPKGERVYWGDLSGRLQSVDAETGEDLQVYPFRHDDLSSLEFSKDGTRLLVATSTGASLWDVPPNNRLVTVTSSRADRTNTASLVTDPAGEVTGVLVAGNGFLHLHETAARPELFPARRAVRSVFLPGTLEAKAARLEGVAGLTDTMRERVLAPPRNRYAYQVAMVPGRTATAYDKALAAARLAVAGTVSGSWLHAVFMDTLGVALLRDGEHEAAIEKLEESLALARKHPHGDPDGFGSTYAYLAIAHQAVGRTGEARKCLATAWQKGFFTQYGGFDEEEFRAVQQAEQALGIEPSRGTGEDENGADRIVGPPDMRFWNPADPDGLEARLEVRFEKAQRIDAVRIFHRFYAGRVTEVRAMDAEGRPIRIWKVEDKSQVPGILELDVDVSPPVRVIQIELDTKDIRPVELGRNLPPALRAAIQRAKLEEGVGLIETVEIVGPDGRQWPSSAQEL